MKILGFEFTTSKERIAELREDLLIMQENQQIINSNIKRLYRLRMIDLLMGIAGCFMILSALCYLIYLVTKGSKGNG